MSIDREMLKPLIVSELERHVVLESADALRVLTAVMRALAVYEHRYETNPGTGEELSADGGPSNFQEQTIAYIEGLARGLLHPNDLAARQDERARQIKAAEQDFNSKVVSINQAHIANVLHTAEKARRAKADKAAK